MTTENSRADALTDDRAFALYMLARTTDSERWVNELRKAIAANSEPRIVTGDYEVDHGTHVELRPIYNEPEPHASPADERAATFEEFRDRCEHYHGFKDETDDTQCTCPGNNHPGSWCEESDCPRRSRGSSANETGAEVVRAWETDDGRVISDEQKQQALRDGGASASSVRPFSIALGRIGAVPAMAAEAVAIYQCMATDDDEAEHMQSGRDLWMDVPRDAYEKLSKRSDVRSRIVYAAPQPAQASSIIEAIAMQWDECMFEGIGHDIDIGAAIRDAWKRLSGSSAQADARIDVEAMLRACVPGGDICDPQRIADSIREWFDEHGQNAAQAAILTREEIGEAWRQGGSVGVEMALRSAAAQADARDYAMGHCDGWNECLEAQASQADARVGLTAEQREAIEHAVLVAGHCRDGYLGDVLNSILAAHPGQPEPRAEVTDDDKRDAARWRAGVAMKRFLQFAYFNGGSAEGKIQGEGPHWYVVTREERYPKRFNTAEEAIDAARAGASS
ncbi:hypothetical protein [Burkholderia cenocepacia]|uniref:hypothetical protein n=1 Tax=Burkholderia cenocepacia TaxID=95486 RepID=UPI002AB17A1D|nr:hypothetical protein [Burkholderia cenocepacia]